MINHALENRLRRAAALWKWQALIKSTALVFSWVLVVALLVGGLSKIGWIGSPTLAIVLIGLAALLGMMGWFVMLVRVLDRKLDRNWLAAAVENDQAGLLDRFNTVVELDQRPQDVSAQMYRDAIERQASSLVRKMPSGSPFSWGNTVKHCAAAMALLLLATWFYLHHRPLRSVAAETADVDGSIQVEDDPLLIPEIVDEVDDQSLASLESSEPWGEVRISEPGRNLRLTRHEDLPLLIEAAADRPLSEVFWSTAVNLEEEAKRGLPELEDPRYAVFQPVLRPVELQLDDWDLVHYRAIAVADDKRQYESVGYFVEIVPSRDQLESLPEPAYEKLEQMTDLIERQQAVIRQTGALANDRDSQSSRRMDALADQEDQIEKAASRFPSDLQAWLEPDVMEPFTAAIGAAGTELDRAESTLKERDLTSARDSERSALMKLAQARRELASLVRDHPEAFAESTLDQIERERLQGATPADPEFAKLLEELAVEARDTAAAATRLEELAADQRQLADQARLARPESLPPLAGQQRGLQQQLEAARETHPSAFRDLKTLGAKATDALARAAEQLESSSSSAPQATDQAYQRLQQLAEEMNARQMAQGLAQSQTLQERLEANRQAYREIQERPEQGTSADLRKTTKETRDLIEQLRQRAAEEATGKRPTELSKRLSPKTASGIVGQCDAMDGAGSDDERSQVARGLGQSLDQLSDALAKDRADQGSRLDQQQIASQLSQMRQREEGLRSARQSVQEALLEQRAIEQEAFADRSQKEKFPSLAQQQLSLEEQLQQAMDKHPDAFKPTASECQSARSAMRQTTQALNANDESASNWANNAAQELERLDGALEAQQQQAGITEKQAVREMLEKLNQRLDDFAKHPNDVTAEQRQQTASQCKSVGSKACQMAGQNAAASSAGGSQGGSPSSSSGSQSASNSPQRPPMESPGESPGSQSPGSQSPGSQSPGAQPSGQPSGGSKSPEQQLEAASDRLAEADNGAQTSSSARALQQQLQRLAEQLGAPSPPGPGGPPGSMSAGRDGRRDSLLADGKEAIDRGLAQLESAARRDQQGTLTPDARQSLQQGGVADIVAGIRSQYGYNDNSRAVVSQLDERLKDPTSPVDMKTLQQLRERIQTLQQDLVMQPEIPDEPDAALQIDPGRFAPAYRESIQKYFEVLSEKP